VSNVRGFIDGEYQDGELRGLMLLAGRRGMGKTTEMDRLLKTCCGGVIFFDSLSKHAGVLSGYVVINQPGQLKEYLRVNRKRAFRVLYQPKQGSLDAHFDAVARIVKAFGWMIFGVDEVDKICGSRWGDARMPPVLYELVNYGRHYRVSMLATARRPMSVARGYTSECSEMRLFKVKEKADIAYFEEFIGATDARRLPMLDKFQFLRWTDGCDEAELCGGRR
jgi:hypothetical protein